MGDLSPDAVPLVLVTGASGYVANHCVQVLQEQGYRVRGTVRSTKNEAKTKPLLSLCPDAKFPLELVEAELLDANSWTQAVRGCDFVLHTASPFPPPGAMSDPHNQIIKPAVDGTLNVLKACAEEGTVKRVVLTSSVAAVFGGTRTPSQTLNEADWTDLSNPAVDPYYRSKTLAERAAWDFVKDLPEDKRFELATINPSFVLGPVLSTGAAAATSVGTMKNLLLGQYPMWPRLELQCCDVRDVALAHLRAMTAPEAGGRRHIVHTQSLMMAQVAGIVRRTMGPLGYSPSTKTMPDFFGWLAQAVDKQAAFAYPRFGLRLNLDNSRMKNVLGVQPRTLEESVADMAHSMIRLGIVKKTRRYAAYEKNQEMGGKAGKL